MFAYNGDIEIAYETFGSTPRHPLLLIQGAGAPMIGWPEEFCEELVKRGHHVARFDNRTRGDRRAPPSRTRWRTWPKTDWPC